MLLSKLSTDSAASPGHTAARRHSAELAADTEAGSGTAGLERSRIGARGRMCLFAR